MEKGIIDKIKEAGLKGRGGGGFSTGLKWELVKNSPNKTKYVICNGAEGELDLFKDEFILDNYLEDVLGGVLLAIKEMEATKGYIYLRKDYYLSHYDRLKELIKDKPVEIFQKPDIGYIGGEETVICEIIEGNPPIPRIKPPYLSEYGLFGCPTLINNVETFYWISKIAKGEYLKKRFYCLSGDVNNSGVFELDEDETVEQVLLKTNNFPTFDFFIQTGGGASGIILLSTELGSKVPGVGSVIVFERSKTDYYALMKKWSEFFHNGNCDKCAPCREGMHIIDKMISDKAIDYSKLEEIFLSLEKTSFCPLGRGIVSSLGTFIEKIFKNENDKH